MVYLKVIEDKRAWTQFAVAFWPAAQEYGLPDQMVTDKGKESSILGWFCEYANMAWGRADSVVAERKTYRAVKSVLGQMRVEGVWRIINNRINYYVVGLANVFIVEGIYDVDSSVQMWSLQRVLLPALRVRAAEERAMYNAHYVESKRRKGVRGGKPDRVAEQFPRPPNMARHVPDDCTLEGMKELWVAGLDGEEDCTENVGGPSTDLLGGSPWAVLRDNCFGSHYCANEIWLDIVSCGSNGVVRGAYLTHLRMTKCMGKAQRQGKDLEYVKAKYQHEMWASWL